VNKLVSRIVLVCLVFSLAALPLAAQEKTKPPEAPPQYSLGDQTFAITLGAFVPLFFMSWEPAAYATHLSVGGLGFLQWQAYITPRIRIGADLGGMFAFSPNLNALFELQLTAKASYVFTFYPFEMPIFLGVGASLVTYQGNSIIDPIIKPGVSLFWIFNSSWSFGLNVVYWWDMQFSGTPGQSRVGNFLEISLSALYHF
jgi:hypothetical protein